MERPETTYGGATGRLSGLVELIADEPTKIGGQIFVPGAQYPADDAAVLANRKRFRVVSESTPQPDLGVRATERLADPED